MAMAQNQLPPAIGQFRGPLIMPALNCTLQGQEHPARRELQ